MLLAADRIYKTPGDGLERRHPESVQPGEADIATNAETQALRQSVDHPNLRIILTVSEGFYRVVARRSAGMTKLADLKGKKIATVGAHVVRVLPREDARHRRAHGSRCHHRHQHGRWRRCRTR